MQLILGSLNKIHTNKIYFLNVSSNMSLQTTNFPKRTAPKMRRDSPICRNNFRAKFTVKSLVYLP
jgi:hypothetical protein